MPSSVNIFFAYSKNVRPDMFEALRGMWTKHQLRGRWLAPHHWNQSDQDPTVTRCRSVVGCRCNSERHLTRVNDSRLILIMFIALRHLLNCDVQRWLVCAKTVAMGIVNWWRSHIRHWGCSSGECSVAKTREFSCHRRITICTECFAIDFSRGEFPQTFASTHARELHPRLRRLFE